MHSLIFITPLIVFIKERKLLSLFYNTSCKLFLTDCHSLRFTSFFHITSQLVFLYQIPFLTLHSYPCQLFSLVDFYNPFHVPKPQNLIISFPLSHFRFPLSMAFKSVQLSFSIARASNTHSLFSILIVPSELQVSSSQFSFFCVSCSQNSSSFAKSSNSQSHFSLSFKLSLSRLSTWKTHALTTRFPLTD